MTRSAEQPDRPVLALDISGSRTLLLRVGPNGEHDAPVEVPRANREAEAYLADIVDATAAWQDSAVAAVGVAFGGPVDRRGRVLSLHVAGWGGVDPAQALRERLGVPVALDNDANLGALGESVHGRWAGESPLVFLTCSTGIGGGIVADGELFRGARGVAGELGHVCVAPDGPPCPCGSRGCLEVMCSGTAIARRAGEALAEGGRVPGAKAVFAAAAAGDAVAQGVLQAVFADFGRGIAAIQNALDPARIVIGGGVSLAGAALTEPVAAAAELWLMTQQRGNLRLSAASLGLHAQLMGAAALAQRALRSPAG